MLKTLELAYIRSYTNGLFEFSDQVNIIVGPNASGKTNLLEAIYMIAQGSAFKSDDEHMLARNSTWGRIDATFDKHERSIKLTTPPVRKVYVLDAVEKKQLRSDKKIPVVLFEPSHMLLLGGEPDRRRQYIDGLLAQTELGYEPLLKNYKRTLAQRNALLKQENITADHLFVWDVRLSDLAGKLVEFRNAYVGALDNRLTDDYRSVSGNEETLHVYYESKFDTEQYSNSLLQKLKSSFDLDRARGFTGNGPHRDDLRIMLDGNDVRESASRGETRSIVLALKIAELRLLEQKLGRKPMLLLDDVFSELDGKRRRFLANTLQKYQTFITTTDADVAIDHFSKSCNIIPL